MLCVYVKSHRWFVEQSYDSSTLSIVLTFVDIANSRRIEERSVSASVRFTTPNLHLLADTSKK